MKSFAVIAALAAAVFLTAGTATATSPCCNAATVGAAAGKACNQDAFPGVPDGAGCQEADDQSCIGGSAGPSGAQGCVCVGGVCVSGPVPPGGPDDIGLETPMNGNYKWCTAAAAAGCDAAGEAHPVP